MTVQEQMRDLLKRHCTNLLDQVEMVGQLLSQSCDVGAQSPTPIAKAQNITHQIIGTTGSMGFPDVAAAASALDDNLQLLAADQHRVSQSQLQVSKQLFARLQKVASQATPERSRLYDADLSRLANNANSTARSRTFT
jgi:HPt (histidine-containing phosphotransfer) domain-containing protein